MSAARRVTPDLVDGDAFWRNVKQGEPGECWEWQRARQHNHGRWRASEGIRNCDIAAGYEIDPSYVSHLKKRRHRREVTHV